MQKDYADVCKHISSNLDQLRKGIPETMRVLGDGAGGNQKWRA